MSTYFNAPVSGTGNGTIAINAKTLNNGTSVRSAVLTISNGEKSENSTLFQRFKPILSRTGSGEISGSGGTMTVNVNSSYPFYFRNNPTNISAITYGNTDYKSINPISSGSYAFNVSIKANETDSARTDTFEIAFQKLNGTYSYNNADAGDFRFSYSQASGGTTPVPPTPSGDTGTTINVPVYLDYDGDYIYVCLGSVVPFDVYTTIELTYRNGNQELLATTVTAGNDRAILSFFGGTPVDFSIFDTSDLNYASITALYFSNGAPEMQTTYGDDEYYLWWSEVDSSNFKTYLENVGNYCLDGVTWGQEPELPIDYNSEYFTVEAISAGTLSWSAQGTQTALKVGLEYSKNEGQWQRWYSGGTVSLVQGDTVRFRGDTGVTYNGKVLSMGGTGRFNVYGNIMSLLYRDNFSGQTTLPYGDVFISLFANSKVVSAKNLILPATALTNYCYFRMFNGCTNLIEAPALPATELYIGCYKEMFSNCTSLVSAPALPATTLFGYCYLGMFSNCTSLVNAPSLPATNLAYNCYEEMFLGCTSLVNAPALPATTLATYCYSTMFKGCTSLVNAPELPATTLTGYCYQYMFQGCSNLNYIKCLATDISGSLCTSNWVLSVQTNSGTFVKSANATSWSTGNSGIPNNWTVVDAT